MGQELTAAKAKISVGKEFSDTVWSAMKASQQSEKPFFIIVLQLQNLEAFSKRRTPETVKALINELYKSIRKAVHPSQYVGLFNNGVGMIFTKVDVGDADNISRRLIAIAQHVIRMGKYNDLQSQWSEILYHFLWPHKPVPVVPQIGWAIYPRDGAGPLDLFRRALLHAGEMSQ